MEQLQTLTYSHEAVDSLRSLVTEGRLMSPPQVTEAFAVRGDVLPPELKGHWSLCGDAPAALFDAIQAPSPSRLMLRLSVFTTPLGGAYLVLTHQLVSSQHRFLLPLWDVRTREGIRALRDGRLRFMLARQCEGLALVLSSSFKSEEIEPVFAYAVPEDPEQLLALVQEMPMVVHTMRQLQAIPSCGRPGPIKEVGLSVLMPVEAVLGIVLGGRQRA